MPAEIATPPGLSDEECLELRRMAGELGDVDLVVTIGSLLAGDGRKLLAAQSSRLAALARMVFLELAMRFVPDDVLEPAIRRVLDENTRDFALIKGGLNAC